MSYADQHPSEQESQAGRLKGKAIRRGRLLLCCVHTQPHIQPHKKKKEKEEIVLKFGPLTFRNWTESKR